MHISGEAARAVDQQVLVRKISQLCGAKLVNSVAREAVGLSSEISQLGGTRSSWTVE